MNLDSFDAIAVIDAAVAAMLVVAAADIFISVERDKYEFSSVGRGRGWEPEPQDDESKLRR